MRFCLAVLLSAMLASSSLAQQPNVAPKTQLQLTLDQKVPPWVKVFDDISVAIAYIENGRVSWISIYGSRFPGGPSADEKTLYPVASLTKPITAEVILRLASTGKLSLDEPISPFWIDPDVKDNKWHSLLTPRMCLTHQTGFPNWRYQTKDKLVFQFEPGTKTGYSGEGYEYVARFAEQKTGQSLEELAKQYVFAPIGMADTSYTPQPWWKDRQAKPMELEPRTQANAADLLRATIGDYAKFVAAIMRDDSLNKQIAGERFRISRNQVTPEKESVLCEVSKEPARCKVAAGPALGWRVVTLDGQTIVDHSGADGDVKTFAYFVPSTQTGAVIFTNGNDDDFEAIERHKRVIRKIVGELYPDRVYVETLTDIL